MAYFKKLTFEKLSKKTVIAGGIAAPIVAVGILLLMGAPLIAAFIAAILVSVCAISFVILLNHKSSLKQSKQQPTRDIPPIDLTAPSLIQRMSIATESYQKCPCTKLFDWWNSSPANTKLIIKNETPENKLAFLSRMTKGSPWMPVLIKFISDSTDMNDNQKRMQTEMLRFLLKGLTVEQMKPLLAINWSYIPYGLAHHNFDCQRSYSMTALEIAVRDKNSDLANLLIQYGAIEADPECDIYMLTQCPNIDITPYRNKLKMTLDESGCLINDVRGVIVNCLVGETISQPRVRL